MTEIEKQILRNQHTIMGVLGGVFEYGLPYAVREKLKARIEQTKALVDASEEKTDENPDGNT